MVISVLIDPSIYLMSPNAVRSHIYLIDTPRASSQIPLRVLAPHSHGLTYFVQGLSFEVLRSRSSPPSTNYYQIKNAANIVGREA